MGLLHVVCAIVALIVGAVIFLSPKGTSSHIRVGWIYVASMFALNASALSIYRLTGSWNVFHVIAVASLAMVAGGILQARYRAARPNWLWRHYHYMAWSYVGLLAATSNEAFVRIPALKQLTSATAGFLPVVASALIVGACGVVIFAKQNQVLGRFRQP